MSEKIVHPHPGGLTRDQFIAAYRIKLGGTIVMGGNEPRQLLSNGARLSREQIAEIMMNLEPTADGFLGELYDHLFRHTIKKTGADNGLGR